VRGLPHEEPPPNGRKNKTEGVKDAPQKRWGSTPPQEGLLVRRREKRGQQLLVGRRKERKWFRRNPPGGKKCEEEWGPAQKTRDVMRGPSGSQKSYSPGKLAQSSKMAEREF